MSAKSDVLIVGAGLAGGLTALRFKKAKPELSVTVIEESKKVGGDVSHTWSFHDTDLNSGSREWLQPIISHSWESHSVVFPRFSREIRGGYHAVRSGDFGKVLEDVLGSGLRLNAKAIRVTDSSVTLENGETITASLVIDARGQLLPSKHAGFQKFIGFDIQMAEPHGLTSPILMDAACPQLDGFRFFYLLPWDANRLLIEETYYSDTPTLNEDRISRSIENYAERKGWKITKIERRERGILPIPMTGDYIVNSMAGEPLPIGTRGGFFHATTGYSLPDTVRMAEFLTSLPEPTTAAARQAMLKFRKPFLSRQRFYRMLNRMLFMASEAPLRYLIMQKFYEQPIDTVERFYSGRSTWTDRLRILSGRPPVPVAKALRSFSESSVTARGATVERQPQKSKSPSEIAREASRGSSRSTNSNTGSEGNA